jgi:hypothetical protein
MESIWKVIRAMFQTTNQMLPRMSNQFFYPRTPGCCYQLPQLIGTGAALGAKKGLPGATGMTGESNEKSELNG